MKFVAYYRVSTRKQGLSGLGLEAQKSLVENYVNSISGGSLMSEYTEVESGKHDNRAKLNLALQSCSLTGSTLIVSKLDRLSRDLHFLTSVMKSGTKFICADNPTASNLTIGILAVIAQEERERIAERTKAALKAAKARGVKLGNPNLHLVRNNDTVAATNKNIANANLFNAAIKQSIEAIQERGITTYSGIANELNDVGIMTRRGGQFYPTTVRNIMLSEGL